MVSFKFYHGKFVYIHIDINLAFLIVDATLLIFL